MTVIIQTLNINNLRTTSEKSKKLVEYSVRNIRQRQCLLLPFSSYCCPKLGRYCEPPSRAQGAKGLKFQWKTKKMLGICWNWLKSDWFTNLGGFEWFLIFFFISLTLSVPEKLKNSIFEIPIITQTLNISNLRTTSGKSINLDNIRKLVEYS